MRARFLAGSNGSEECDWCCGLVIVGTGDLTWKIVCRVGFLRKIVKRREKQ